jgi:polysaccharide export outer membrane protein
MFRLALVAFAWLVSAAALTAAAQDEKAVPKDLIQYVRDAQKAGLKPSQILQKAIQAGWPEATVNDALEGVGPKDDASKEPAVKSAAITEPAGEKAADKVAPAAAETPAGTPPVAKPQISTEAAPPAVSVAPVNPARDKNSDPVRGDNYLIGEGDVLQISVWGEPTASVPVATVRTDGKISMPLIKEVQVAGLTPAQVEAIVQEQLGKIIRTPDVTVIVAQINSKKIYLTGQVKREGPLKYTYRMTVLQAISEAGGLTDYAKRKEIYVLHTENGRQYKLPFNYISVLRGEHMEQNILLSPGDTIVVP